MLIIYYVATHECVLFSFMFFSELQNVLFFLHCIIIFVITDLIYFNYDKVIYYTFMFLFYI